MVNHNVKHGRVFAHLVKELQNSDLLTNYQGDLLLDGLSIMKYENPVDFIWVLRELGTYYLPCYQLSREDVEHHEHVINQQPAQTRFFRYRFTIDENDEWVELSQVESLKFIAKRHHLSETIRLDQESRIK